MKRYVVQCIKSNRNKFGFGYFHKKGQYVSYSGKAVKNINFAYVYDTEQDSDNSCSLDEQDTCEWKEYYKYVNIKLLPIKGEL